jgi:drug/metabolite transporter (DMT)-like permease
MIKPKPQLRAYAMLGLVMLFWAGNSIVGRAVRSDIPPFTLALVRWVGALLVLAPFALRHTIAEWKIVRQHWPIVLLLGMFGVAGFNGFLYSGLHYTTASNALLIQALIPALVLLGGAIVFRDRAPLGQIAGVALSTLGVVAIVFRGDPMAIVRLHFGPGDSLILCGCLAWAIYTICLRRAPPVHPLTFLFVTFMIGAATMAPLAMSEMKEIAQIPLRPGTFAAFAYVAVLPSVCAYFLYNAAVARIGSGAAGQTISLMPLFGALLAAALLDERLEAYHGAGMALILSGVLLSALAGARHARS